MIFDRSVFKTYTPKETEEWSRKNYGDWLLYLQNQDYEPQTPAEKFFRYYTQGVHNFFNNITRNRGIDTYDFDGTGFSRDMFYDCVYEINCHPTPDDIVVYRFIPKRLIKHMLEWGNSKSLKRNSILVDKVF